MPSVLLPPIGSSAQVQVHPVALFSICDAYIRRNEKQERVIGTLLGTVSNTVIEIKSCYVVPHNESADQVAVDINHHKTMSELHQKVNPQEVIVGWFSTGLSISSSDALIQEFYSKECASPVHLVVDAALSTQRFVTKAYVSRTIGLGEKNLAAEFIEVPCEVLFGEAQRVGLDASVTATSVSVKPPTDAESVTASLHRVQDMLGKVLSYVDDVLAGRRAGDASVCRYLADTLALVPRIKPADFEALFNGQVQDVLLVSYLANLVRTQVALAEKLGTAQLPLV